MWSTGYSKWISNAAAFNRMLEQVASRDELERSMHALEERTEQLSASNAELIRLSRAKDDFVATMSHELRTPLNSILGFSDVLGSIDALNEKQKRYVENIQKSGRLLLEMINNVLDLAKVESGKMELRLTTFDVRSVIGAQCDMARPLSEKKNIDLIEEIQPDLPPMHQDQGRIQQVLNNLLSNAIKFTPEGGRIKVVARRDDQGRLVIQVVDTGVGIAEDDLVAADADLVAVPELVPLDQGAVDERPVGRSEIRHLVPGLEAHDRAMAARRLAVRDGDVAVGGATDGQRPALERELLFRPALGAQNQLRHVWYLE